MEQKILHLWTSEEAMRKAEKRLDRERRRALLVRKQASAILSFAILEGIALVILFTIVCVQSVMLW